jgi:hypothetical protein
MLLADDRGRGDYRAKAPSYLLFERASAAGQQPFSNRPA